MLGAVEGGIWLLILGLSAIPWGITEECGKVPDTGWVYNCPPLPAGGTAVTIVPTVFLAFGYQQRERHS